MIPEEETELEEAIYEINTILEPGDGGSINVIDEIKEGEDLEFTVTVNEGYALPVVSINGEEIEADEEDLENAEFSYLVSGIHSDTDVIDINVMFMPSNDILDQLNIEPMAIEYGINEDTLKDSYDLMPGDRKSLDGTVDHGNNDEWFFVEADGKTRIDSVPGIEITGTWKRVEVDGSIATVNPGVFSEPVYIAHTYQRLEIVGEIFDWDYVDYIEYFKINVTNPETPAYFYVKKNPNIPDSDSSADYMYWGTGSVPFGNASNYDVKHDYIDDDWKDLIVWPEDHDFVGAPGYDSDGYPILTDGNEEYFYQNSSDYQEGDNYYTISWNKYTVAAGAVGADGETPIEGTYTWELEGLKIVQKSIPTWHVDADVEFHNEDSVQIKPRIQNFESVNSENISWKDYEDLPDGEMLPKENTGEEAITLLGDWSDIQAIAADISLAEEAGYEFEWYLNEAGTTLAKADAIDELVAVGKNVIYVYGIYKEEQTIPTEKYTLSYNANGAEGEVPQQQTAEQSNNYTVTVADKGTLNKIDAAFIGWSKNQTDLIVNDIDVPKDIISANSALLLTENTLLYAVWAEDINGDQKPDYDQLRLNFIIDTESGVSFDKDSLTGDYKLSSDEKTVTYVYPNTEPGGEFRKKAPELLISDPDIEFAGWYCSGQSYEYYIDSTKDPYYEFAEVKNFTAKLIKDINGDDTDDSEQILLIFDLAGQDGASFDPKLEDAYITSMGGSTVAIFNITDGGLPDAPKVAVEKEKKKAFDKWMNGNTEYDPETAGSGLAKGDTVTYKATYDDDENNDGIPDGQQTKVFMRPFATTIYSGGNSGYDHYDGTGFPELELEVKLGEAFTGEEDRGNRGARNDLVTGVNINGTWLTCEDSTEGINEYLEAIYVYLTESGDYEIISDDSEYREGGYRAVVAVKETALSAFNSADYYSDPDTHLIRNSANGDKYVTISDQSDEGLASIGIRACESEESDNIINYFVTFTTSSLKIRETVGDETEIYKDVEVRESDVNVAEDQEATAYVPADDNGDQVYYTNGDEFRVVDDDLGITLLEDNVRTDDNRIDLIEDKGYMAAYQMSAEEAEAAGYKSILKYYDLIDNLNGNAWVQSATGTYVYIPYPEGTDQDTEFELMHFKGLHRDTNYEGEEVAAAIEASVLEDGTELQLENTPQGIKFFTSGDDAFSPFMLMWKTDNTGDNGNTGNTGTGIAGGHNESDRNSIGGTYYTVGVNGNWRHMDNVDVNVPLDEAVPAGATAMAAPEWHRWKFFRNDGSNIRSQWAHIANPYAVDDQPKTGWFYFDAEGLMQYGWFLDTATGKWYYLHAESDGMLGTMMTGWHYDLNDGRWYYLDPATGEMLIGWQNIGGKWYYFNTAPNEQTWNLDSVAGLWRFNNSTARPLGSMYINETTPDGYQVDGSGAWIQ